MADTTRVVIDRKELIGAWVATKVNQTGSWGDFYALGVMRGSTILAGVVFNNYNGANATCHIAIDKPGKATIKLLQAAYDYAFNKCKLKRLTGMVPTNEPEIIKFDKHLGWQEEFIMKDGAPGADMMVLVMTPESGARWRT